MNNLYLKLHNKLLTGIEWLKDIIILLYYYPYSDSEY